MPLRAAGLSIWAGGALIGGVLPSGCRDDTIASAIAWAGVPAVTLIAVDLVRRTRMATSLLLAWAIVFWLGTWGTASSDWGDCDHLIGVALWATFPAVVGAAVGGFGYSLWWLATRASEPSVSTRSRRWSAKVEGLSLVITRRRPPPDQ